ncbi:uncharacterized protein LOC118436999 [Folsomia candida]|uniref:uncharacterized protein LOC118436999 n=1 Tax=Folsomia candida TaxID=158441 RepID=UPI0016054CE7|nr:uncharacterized protein LOC118436999 [Folsomia candida]
MPSKKWQPKNLEYKEPELIGLIVFCFLYGLAAGYWLIRPWSEAIAKLASKEPLTPDAAAFIALTLYFVMMPPSIIILVTWRNILAVRKLKETAIPTAQDKRDERTSLPACRRFNPALHSDCILILEEVVVG